MIPPRPRHLRVALLLPTAATLLAACAASPRAAAVPEASPAAPPQVSVPTQPPAAPAHDMSAHAGHDMGAAKITIPPGAIYTEADVRFMQGMIAHHAQAVVMSQLAPTRAANPRLVRLAQKIDLAQAGEIVLMQDWLRANKQFVPDTSSWRTMTMHGMLTKEELAALENAKGAEFDRLFLTGMIRHHEGAIKMVADLFKTPRAGQDVDVNVFANDVETTQTAEIGVMRAMLDDM